MIIKNFHGLWNTWLVSSDRSERYTFEGLMFQCSSVYQRLVSQNSITEIKLTRTLNGSPRTTFRLRTRGWGLYIVHIPTPGPSTENLLVNPLRVLFRTLPSLPSQSTNRYSLDRPPVSDTRNWVRGERREVRQRTEEGTGQKRGEYDREKPRR